MLEVSLEGFVPANTCHPKGKCNVHTSCPSPSKEGWGSKCFVQPTPEICVSALKQDALSRQRRPCYHASLCPLFHTLCCSELPPQHPNPTPRACPEMGAPQGETPPLIYNALSSTFSMQILYKMHFKNTCNMHKRSLHLQLYLFNQTSPI